MPPVYWLVVVGSRRLQRVKLRDPYRLVLFVLPPVLVGNGLVAFAPKLGTAMLVVEDPRTQGDELAHSINLFVGSIELRGTVSNKSTEENLVTTITIRKSGYLPRCTPSLFTLLQVDVSFSCPAGL
jgi:hypothetical protein